MSNAGSSAGSPASLVRPMRPEDVPAIVALAAGEPTAPHWPVAEYHRMLEVIAESPGRRGAWILLLQVAARMDQPTRHQAAATRLSAPQVAGFAMASHVAGISELEAVVVEAGWRGRRFAVSLVEAAAAWGLGLGARSLQLEVRASNTAAHRLYQRMGFATDGTRAGYYRNPQEDAILMSLQLGSGNPGAIA